MFFKGKLYSMTMKNENATVSFLDSDFFNIFEWPDLKGRLFALYVWSFKGPTVPVLIILKRLFRFSFGFLNKYCSHLLNYGTIKCY